MSDINLLDYIRPYNPVKDAGLPEYSHSRLECYCNCPYQFKIKYIEGKTTVDTTIALSCGSICHKVLELKGQMLKEGKPVDYDYLMEILNEGYPDEKIIGLTDIKKKFWEDFSVADSEGHTYQDKFTTFEQILKTEMEDSDWQPYEFEKEFHFVYKDRIHIKGFIDRIDKCGDEYRLIDYKTSKKVFDEAKNKTAQQFCLYEMAMLLMYGKLASDNIYRFIFLNQEQHALSKGWEGRIIRRLDKTLDAIDDNIASGLFIPKPSPLCYWCYLSVNPTAKQYRGECDYRSNWTPTNKDFSVNKEWNPELTDRKAKAFDW